MLSCQPRLFLEPTLLKQDFHTKLQQASSQEKLLHLHWWLFQTYLGAERPLFQAGKTTLFHVIGENGIKYDFRKITGNIGRNLETQPKLLKLIQTHMFGLWILLIEDFSLFTHCLLVFSDLPIGFVHKSNARKSSLCQTPGSLLFKSSVSTGRHAQVC